MDQMHTTKLCIALTIILGFAANVAISKTFITGDQTAIFGSQGETEILKDVSPLISVRDQLNQSQYIGVLASKKQGGLGRLLSSNSVENAVLSLLFNMVEKNIQETFANLNLSAQCNADLSKFFSALMAQETWAIRILDASGKLVSGFLDGNLYWYGNYDECLTTIPTELDSNNQTVQLFNTHYLITSVPFMGLPKGLQLGSCYPESCTATDVNSIVQTVLAPLEVDPKFVQTSVKPETFPLDTPAIVMISILSVLLMLLVVATGYDIAVYQPILEQEREQQESGQGDSGHGSGRASPSEAANSILRADEYTPLLVTKTKAPVNPNDINIVAKVLLKFSVYSNGSKLLHTGQTSGSVLGSIHGIRFISMTWVILGHTYFYALTNSQNIAIFQQFLKSISFQAIVNATVSVDTFFLLSGLLVAYLLLKEMKEKGGPKQINWPLFFFHRFWRLTPPYMLVLGAYTTLFKYFGNGPAWPGNVPEPNCSKNWWTNLLYINNVYKSNQGCMMWTWYLSNDMQFYIISPLILIPLYFHFGAGLAVLLVIMLISFITSGVISVQNAYPPSTAAILYYLEKIMDYFQNYYMVPWTRIGPYLVGILVGYALYRTDRKVSLQWYTVVIGWALAAGVNLAILYGLYDVANGTPIDPNVSALYNTVHRTLWAAGVGWVIFACVTGYGGPVNKLLSWPALVPLSRLTYMAYLIHPIIMQWFYLSSKTPIYLSVSNMIYLFFGHLVMAYGMSFVLSLAFEAPMMALEKLIFKRN